MFLRGSLDLAPASLLANPQLEKPFLYPENHRNILPSWLSRERTATRYHRRRLQRCLRQPRPRKENPAKFSVKEKPSPARTRFRVRRKTNATGGVPFYWTSRHALCQLKRGRENPAKFFPSRKNSSQHAQRFTCAAKIT